MSILYHSGIRVVQHFAQMGNITKVVGMSISTKDTKIHKGSDSQRYTLIPLRTNQIFDASAQIVATTDLMAEKRLTYEALIGKD